MILVNQLWDSGLGYLCHGRSKPQETAILWLKQVAQFLFSANVCLSEAQRGKQKWN